jgi:DNA polymerase I-like protein with 3'-5' exonuclease and polymerase domains
LGLGAGLERAKQILPDPVAAEEFYNRYEAQMPVAAEWRRKQAALAKNPGYVISRTGRRRRFPQGQDYGPEAINAPVQVGASDCTVASATRLVNEGHRVLLLVHDELIAEVPYAQRETMLSYVEQAMAEEGARLFPEVKWNADGKWSDRWAEQLTDEEINGWMISGGLEVNDGLGAQREDALELA